jgi:hypothetical protein
MGHTFYLFVYLFIYFNYFIYLFILIILFILIFIGENYRNYFNLTKKEIDIKNDKNRIIDPNFGNKFKE